MNDLKVIKKKYGEKMMQLCRELFPSLLEKEGLLSSLMLEHFEQNKSLYEDIVNNRQIDNFKNYIYSFMDREERSIISIKKTPFELLSEVGYNLYECKTEDEIQRFKKYYAKGEELCTFRGGRLSSCYVFFAVKKDVDNIKREDYKYPKREDLYGTSVISIQFKNTPPNTLSIKNRYNHTVNNPDNTFNNNLDNIIPGLTDSFKENYNLNFEYEYNNLEIPGYVNVNGKFYKYNYEINNIYYCPNNIIIDNFIIIDKYTRGPERYIVMDYYVIDLKLKTIEIYDKDRFDGFIDEFKNINNIVVSRDKDNKTIEIIYDDEKRATIVIDKYNRMIEYYNNYQTILEEYSLYHTRNLSILNLPNLVIMKNRCLRDARGLTNIIVPNLEEMGNNCLVFTKLLEEFIVLKLEKMGDGCLKNNSLKKFDSPNLIEMGDICLNQSICLEKINIPMLKKIGAACFNNVPVLENFYAPNLEEIGSNCMVKANNLVTFNASFIKVLGNGCLCDVNKLISFEMPYLIKMGDMCLSFAGNLVKFEVPSLEVMGFNCLSSATNLKEFKADNLVEMGDSCLYDAPNLAIFEAPKLTKIGNRCIHLSNRIEWYKDANKEYERDEEIIKMDKTNYSLIENLSKILKSNLYRIKEFKKRLVEGVRNR